MIGKYSDVLKFKEFGWVFLLLTFFALYLVKVAFQQSPFNSFEDDASWLVPSLALDMSTLSWPEQLARDVGERGAISLNMMLRFLYLIFEGWPTGYILFGIFAHTICSFLLFVVLRKCGVARVTSLVTMTLFFFCSLQFHAIFWIIGVQHVLAVGSIFATCVIAHHFFRLAYCQYHKLSFGYCTLALFLLFLLGFNRASIAINLFAWSLFFFYYALKLGGVVDKSSRLSAGLRLYGFYAAGMLVIPAFSFYQLAHQGEGWQVINIIQHAGIPIAFLTYFSSVAHLYIGLTFVLALICALTFLVSTYTPHLLRRNFATLCYFSGIAGIFATLIVLDKTQNVLPSILENLFFIPDIDILHYRWSPVDAFRFESSHTTPAVNTVLCFAMLLIFICTKPKKNSAKLFGATLFLMMTLGLIYFNSLTKPPLSLNALPSRYAYYFTPAILLGLTAAFVKLLSQSLPQYFSYCLTKYAFLEKYVPAYFRANTLAGASKWPFVSVIALALAVCTFVVANSIMLNQRLGQSKVDAFYNQFANNASFVLAESIASWVKTTVHTGDISINLYGYKGLGWYFGPFMPPVDSEFDPFIFNTQAYLTQLVSKGTKLSSLYGSADIMLCGGVWYGRTRRPADIARAECAVGAPSLGGAPTPDEFLQENGAELQILRPRLIQESALLREPLIGHLGQLQR